MQAPDPPHPTLDGAREPLAPATGATTPVRLRSSCARTTSSARWRTSATSCCGSTPSRRTGSRTCASRSSTSEPTESPPNAGRASWWLTRVPSRDRSTHFYPSRPAPESAGGKSVDNRTDVTMIRRWGSSHEPWRAALDQVRLEREDPSHSRRRRAVARGPATLAWCRVSLPASSRAPRGLAEPRNAVLLAFLPGGPGRVGSRSRPPTSSRAHSHRSDRLNGEWVGRPEDHAVTRVYDLTTRSPL